MSPERRRWVEGVTGGALAHLDPILADVPADSRAKVLAALTDAIATCMEAEVVCCDAGCRSGDALGRIRGALGAIRKLCDAKSSAAWSAAGG